MGTKKRRLKSRLGAEETRVEELHDRPEVAHVVLHRCAGERDPIAGRQRARGTGLLGLRVLDVLRLVEDDALPGHRVQRRDVPLEQGVAGDHHVVLECRLAQGRATAAGTAMVHHDRQIWA